MFKWWPRPDYDIKDDIRYNVRWKKYKLHIFCNYINVINLKTMKNPKAYFALRTTKITTKKEIKKTKWDVKWIS